MIVGVVPCAGASVRMGRAKALMEVDGVPFVAAVVSTLRDGGCDEVIVVVSDDDAVRDAALRTGATVLRNADPGEGPITSLRIALEARPSGTEAVVYHSVDYPFVRSSTVRTLIANARAARAHLALPVCDAERGHPSYLGEALFPEFMDPGLAGGARTVVHRHLDTALRVEVEDRGIHADIDTPEAFERALAERAGGTA